MFHTEKSLCVVWQGNPETDEKKSAGLKITTNVSGDLARFSSREREALNSGEYEWKCRKHASTSLFKILVALVTPN
jgi:hypothetical protein